MQPYVGMHSHMSTTRMDAVAYYSGAAARFHASYSADANRQERLQVWRRFIDRFLSRATFAYDLGCGSGILACELARRGIETVGVDGAPGMLAIARRSAMDEGLGRAQFVEATLPIALPERWKTADAVISSSALEYLPSLPEALLSIRGLLRPGGMLVFSISNRDSLSRAIVRLVHRLTGYPVYFGLLRQFSTPERLKADLDASGFSYLEHAHFARADRITRLLAWLLPERRASNMIIVAARRR
jgi:SAM-dependent methyltransferase